MTDNSGLPIEGTNAELPNVERALLLAVQVETAYVAQIPLSRDQRVLIMRQACDEIKQRLTSATDSITLYDLASIIVTMIAHATLSNLEGDITKNPADDQRGNSVTSLRATDAGIALVRGSPPV